MESRRIGGVGRGLSIVLRTDLLSSEGGNLLTADNGHWAQLNFYLAPDRTVWPSR